jgi:hypothetical protein
MAERTGKCINFGLCSKADSREIIQIAGGGGDFSCPECGKPLTEAAGAAAATGGGKSGSGKKAVAIGALGLALIAGTAYKYLHEPEKKDDNPNKVENVGVPPNAPADPQNPNGPVVPPDAPAMPQNPNGPGMPQNPNGPGPALPPGGKHHRPAPPPPDESAETPPSPVHSGTGTMVARLLSAINTKTASQGDTFTAKLEDGPYRGGILTGTIRKLKKGKKNVDLELEFNKLNGKQIPVGLDLVDITNAHGVKGVDDENNKITGSSSKKKVVLVTAGAAAFGTVIGAIKGGKKGAVIGGAAGAGAGYLVSMKLMTRAQDVDLQPGSRLTLRTNGR